MPFSGGLFQINIKANDIGGLGCPSAFSGIFKWSGGVVVTNTVKIENCPLYDKCMGVTFTPSTNIGRACDL